MAGLMRKFYSPLSCDLLFAGAGLAGAVGLVVDVTRSYPAIAPSAGIAKGAALVGAVVAAAVLAMLTTRFDRRHADDFVFHTLTRSAFTAMFTTLFALAIWQVAFVTRLGGVSSYATIGVMVVSWSLAYFATRLRGTGA
ncbi:hypothetical protein ABDK56_12970 [Sphingomonas sp. ASV193]|uniref:hypothetical protein n=1 Tax=Sphingomonas sp. ASV193 TaxID=3144405 RepID=UPI0032E8C023